MSVTDQISESDEENTAPASPAIEDEAVSGVNKDEEAKKKEEIAALENQIEGSLINFDFDSYLISDLESSRILVKTLKQLISHKGTVKLVITGHTCNMGPEEYNQQLGLKRANSMKDYLIAQNIDIEIDIVSLGETNPLVDNSSKENRSKNRRVEFNIE